MNEQIEKIQKLADRMALIDRETGIPPSVYLKEEIAETIIELAKMQKNVCKFERKKEDFDSLFEEMVDVLVTILVFLKDHGVEDSKILEEIHYKLTRAIERFNTSGNP